MNKRLISIVSPCFNEEENIEELYERLNRITSTLISYDFEFLFIDNASIDNTQKILKDLANNDKRVKLIINTRNFGHARSPYWGIIQSFGDATIYLASDLQDPPELIPDFLKFWESGFKVVWATKPVSQTSFLMHFVRKKFYDLLDKVSDFDHVKNATGFGLYDKKVLDEIRKINDPCPYFRGVVAELGYDIATIDFNQPRRLKGVSKNNFYSLYDYAVLALISHSKLPIRLASFLGVLIGLCSIIVALVFLILKIIYWDSFQLGIAPIVIGLFFLFGLMFLFIGVIGEYIGSIHTYLQNRPIVVEKERVNFDRVETKKLEK